MAFATCYDLLAGFRKGFKIPKYLVFSDIDFENWKIFEELEEFYWPPECFINKW